MTYVPLHQLSFFPSPVPPWSDTMGPVTVRGNDNQIVTTFNAHDADASIHIGSGSTGALPAANVTSGTFGSATSDAGTYTFSHQLSVTGLLAAAANATVGGTLVVTGLVTANAGVSIGGGTQAAGLLTYDGTTDGLQISAKSGGTNDFVLYGTGGGTPKIMRVPAGTINPVFPGNVTITGTLTSGLINGQTISSAANFTGSLAAVGPLTLTNTAVSLSLVGTGVTSALISYTTNGTARWTMGTPSGSSAWTLTNGSAVDQLTITQAGGATFAAGVSATSFAGASFLNSTGVSGAIVSTTHNTLYAASTQILDLTATAATFGSIPVTMGASTATTGTFSGTINHTGTNVTLGNQTAADSFVSIGSLSAGNNTIRLQFLESSTQTNWQISTNNGVAGNFRITPSTAGGGNIFTGSVLELIPTGATVTGTLGVTGVATFSSDAKIGTVGSGLYVKEGTNATMGVATLNLGSVTVATTKVTANSRIFACRQDDPSGLGVLPCDVTSRVVGTSFTVKSSNALDNATVAWVILEPS